MHTSAFCLLVTVALGLSQARAQVPVRTPPPISGHELSAGSIKPSDVLARVLLVEAHLELIRIEMGRPRVTGAPFIAEGATPREAYAVASALLRKADRLTFELTRSIYNDPATPTGEINPVDVYRLVDLVLARTLEIKAALGIPGEPQEAPAPPATRPDDVFNAILRVGRQLNALLERQFSSADVFQQVTVAIGLTARLLARFPGAERIPAQTDTPRGKSPADVHQRLRDCFHQVRKIGQTAGLRLMTLKDGDVDGARLNSGDNYDLARLLVSELVWQYGKINAARSPVPSYYPGRKFPSHVFQRAEQLLEQLHRLEGLAREEPGWLK